MRKSAAARRKDEQPTPSDGSTTTNATTTTTTSRLERELESLAIKATSQESRFYTESITTSSKEVDLKQVNLFVGARELLQDAHLRLKEGVHYGFVGRNGTGKSTLLRALGDGLIPGLPSNMKILLVSQLDSETMLEKLSLSKDNSTGFSVMEAVLQNDKHRVNAEREVEELGKAIDSQDQQTLHRVVSQITLEKTFKDLEEARRISPKSSGARGAIARKNLIEAEKDYERAKEDISEGGQKDWLQEACSLHARAVSMLEVMDAASVTARAYSILQGLGFTKKQIEDPFMNLSGGWKSRVSLASALLQHCEILLLDEPINYLDMPSILWLQRFVADRLGTVVTVAHDVEFLNEVTEELIVLKREKLHYFDGNLFQYQKQEKNQFKHARRQQEALDKKRGVIEKSITEAKRQAKKSGDENKQRMVKSREKKLQDRWGLEVNAAGHRFKLNRDFGGYHHTSRGEVEVIEKESSIHFTFPDPEPLRFAGSCLHIEDVSYTYPSSKKQILKNISLTMELGDRVGIVGPNGHGKSTLLELITGSRKPTSGSITLHPRLKLSYYAQHALTSPTLRESSLTALEHFIENAESSAHQNERMARSFLASFELKGRVADAVPVSKLSGGQRVKLILAEIMCSGPDLVIFDEVTTHLDSDTVQALISALKSFAGAVLFVSHDRHAIKEIVEGKKSQVEEDDTSVESSEEDQDELARPGRTFLLQDRQMRLMKRGVESYVDMVEKRLAK